MLPMARPEPRREGRPGRGSELSPSVAEMMPSEVSLMPTFHSLSSFFPSAFPSLSPDSRGVREPNTRGDFSDPPVPFSSAPLLNTERSRGFDRFLALWLPLLLSCVPLFAGVVSIDVDLCATLVGVAPLTATAGTEAASCTGLRKGLSAGTLCSVLFFLASWLADSVRDLRLMPRLFSPCFLCHSVFSRSKMRSRPDMELKNSVPLLCCTLMALGTTKAVFFFVIFCTFAKGISLRYSPMMWLEKQMWFSEMKMRPWRTSMSSSPWQAHDVWSMSFSLRCPK
mmetsp:Transcript_22264/g.87713  ORF Transcript_22264/g.87713 Transcript_22264/m.87713 type:complete len:282 (-) Transcript_22264:299-1144(-)